MQHPCKSGYMYRFSRTHFMNRASAHTATASAAVLTPSQHHRWNFTPSPGWTKDESLILKLCLMKFGIGQWVQIQATGLLPGKLIQQLCGATQRLCGQQSLAGMGNTGALRFLNKVSHSHASVNKG
jgi:hypothetical protein